MTCMFHVLLASYPHSTLGCNAMQCIARVQSKGLGSWLCAQDSEVDAVKAYVGMRKISLGSVGPGGRLRPLLNNEFVFQLGFLDQVSDLAKPCLTPPQVILKI